MVYARDGRARAAVALLAALLWSPGVLAAPAYYVDKVASTPDYTQWDPAYGGIPDGGSACGPTAASDGLMWLSDNGFPNLSAHTADGKKDQYGLICTLRNGVYMPASGGTSLNRFCQGIADYVHDCGYEYSRLEYQGWRNYQNEFDTRHRVPDLDWLREGISSPYGVAWLGVGWYTYDEPTDVYSRVGGHYVSLVGYGRKSDNPYDFDPDYLIIHDPATGTAPENEYPLPEVINSGTLTGGLSGLPYSAEGFHKLTGDWRISTSADFGILDCVMVMELVQIPGDATGDGVVDEADAAVLADNWGETDASWAMGDFDGDRVVGPGDASILAANWGHGSEAGEPSVPEPSTLALLLAWPLALWVRWPF